MNNIIYQYTQGDCWVLSLTLNQLYNYPIITINESDKTFLHALNKNTNNKYIDILDEYSYGELIEYWEEQYNKHVYIKQFNTVDEYYKQYGYYEKIYDNHLEEALRLLDINTSRISNDITIYSRDVFNNEILIEHIVL